MIGFISALEQAYQVAFTKYDKELIKALETAELILAEHRNELNSEQLCKLDLTIGICKIKMDYSDDFLPLLLEAEHYALKSESKSLLIRCLNLQANHLMRTGHLQDSVQKLLNLLEIVETEDSRISNYNNLGLVYISLGMFDKALECLFENLKLCEKINNNRGYVRSAVNIGICYCEMHNYEKSVEYFQAAQKISADYPDDESKMFLIINLGLTYAHIAEFEKALELINEAINKENSFEFVKNKGSLIYNLGFVYELKEEYDVALNYYEESLVTIRTTPNVILLASVLNNKAGVHIKKGDYSQAEDLLLESLKITTDSSIPTQREECLKKLAMLYKETGKFQEALEYLTQYQTLNETIFNDKVKNGVIKYESDYLTEKLEQKAEIFRLQNVDLVEKNTIISQKQQQLEEALAQLSESNATKDKLFSIIAHDLRGPVSSLQMALQVIVSTDCSKENQDIMLNSLNEQTKNTYNLLENLLWWAQAQKEGLKLNLETFVLNPIIDNISNVYHAIALYKQIEIEMYLDDNIEVHADKDAVGLILRNLIGNAIKYSFSNSTVTITSKVDADKITVCVIDQGSGINPEIISAIQNNNKIQSIPGTDSEKGMGLGLSLCYEFASLMNGKISLGNDTNTGTCFCLELPAK